MTDPAAVGPVPQGIASMRFFMKIVRGALVLCLALASAGWAQAEHPQAVRIYVAPAGAVAGTDIGTKTNPAGTLAAAQTLVRAAIAKSGAARQRIEVVIAPGEYMLDAPLALTP